MAPIDVEKYADNIDGNLTSPDPSSDSPPPPEPLVIPTRHRMVLLALGFILIIVLNFLIGNGNWYAPRPMYEVIPIHVPFLPFAGTLITLLIRAQPDMGIRVWIILVLASMNVLKRPFSSWRKIGIVVATALVGTLLSWLAAYYGREWSGISEMGVLGLWRYKECFDYAGLRYCQVHDEAARLRAGCL